MKARKLLEFLLLLAYLASCQKEFDPTGEWQESYAAYCLLNLKDSVQFVRVNRVFLTPDHPATYFQTADSVNVNPEIIEVSMITLKDGQQEGEPVYFLPTNAFPKEEGLFAGEEYYVYRSPVMLKADRSYRLIVRNRESGFMMQAETDLLGSRTLEYSFIQTRFYNINQYHPESVDYNGSLITSQFEKRVIRLLYYDVKDDKKYLRYVDWRSPYLKFESAQFTDTAQLSDDMFRYFGEHIPLDTSVKRIAVGVDKMLIINDEMVTLFMNYYNYVLNGQYVPSLSSFDQGQGLFASRYNYTFFAMRLKAKTIDSLAHGRFTGHLGFIDSNGNESIQK